MSPLCLAPPEVPRRGGVRGRELVFEVDRITRTETAPGTVTIPAGERHGFWNAGHEEAHYVQEFRPALKIRAFFEPEAWRLA